MQQIFFARIPIREKSLSAVIIGEEGYSLGEYKQILSASASGVSE